MITPPSAGATIFDGCIVAHLLRERDPDRLRVARMFEQQRALHVAGTVQSGREAEVAAEQRARFAEECGNVERHGRRE